MSCILHRNALTLLLFSSLAIAAFSLANADEMPASPSASAPSVSPKLEPLKVEGTWLVRRGGSEIMIEPQVVLVRGEVVQNNRELVVDWKNHPFKEDYLPYSQLKAITGYNGFKCVSQQVETVKGEKNTVTVGCDSRHFGMGVRKGTELYPPSVTAVRGKFINLHTGERGVGSVTLDENVQQLIVLSPEEVTRYKRLSARYYGTSPN